MICFGFKGKQLTDLRLGKHASCLFLTFSSVFHKGLHFPSVTLSQCFTPVFGEIWYKWIILGYFGPLFLDKKSLDC